MALLGRKAIDSKEQEKNARGNNFFIVLLVLAVLVLYVYLFTHIAGFLNLPYPQDLIETSGIQTSYAFDHDKNIDSNLVVSLTQKFKANDDERLVLFASVALAFIFSYYLPFKYKISANIACFLTALSLLYGLQVTLIFLAIHCIIHLFFHFEDKQKYLISFGAGILLHGAGLNSFTILNLAGLLLSGSCAYLFYRYLIINFLKNKYFRTAIQTIIIQSAILTVLAGAIFNLITQQEWKMPLPILLFFWQWERMIMYHLDYKAQRVPKNLSLLTYLSLFFTPAMLSNWHWGVTIGQGYKYVTHHYFSLEKTKVILSGVKILLIALFYLVFGDWIMTLLVKYINAQGITLYTHIRTLVKHFVAGDQIKTITVLGSCFLEQIRWFFLWGGVVHFKVGVWRILGYEMDPYFNKPWLATNLVSFWARFTFHYREFLVRAFYYPVFCRFFKKHKKTRIFAATFAATGFGNFVWGHITEGAFYHGFSFGSFLRTGQTWPYFAILGLSISLTEVYLLHKKRTRKPWSRDWKIILDIIAVYCTIQFYGLIQIFARPVTNGTLLEYTRLFLRGFGIHL